jgi:hypothetical protein
MASIPAIIPATKNMMEIRLRHVVITGALLISFAAGWFVAYRSSSHRQSRILVMSRSFLNVSGYTNPAPALASVVVDAVDDRLRARVELEVTTDYGTGYTARELGGAVSITEAIQRWGLIEWREDGLHVGRGTNEFFMKKAELEEGWR